ncbi:MAG: hypothetical protein RDU20_14565 [Desulfomonilaceae bacterium]|nr:hypothetical protein [Desulfomonilaceae bacterium]
MSSGASVFRVSSAVILATMIGIFLFVEYRRSNPEWKVYQQRGVELALRQLQEDLAKTRDPADQEKIRSEIETLEKREPGIIEIRPFGGKLELERCLTCHFGIEDLSASHPNSVFGCVICHGGNGPDLTVRGAHLGLRGGRNPASLDLAHISCGSSESTVGTCHSRREDPLLDRTRNVPRSLMATNAGIMSILRYQWGVDETVKPAYAVRSVTDGTIALEEIPPETTPDGRFSIVESHFRKFCAACHLWSPRHRENMGRLEGCPACHAPYEEGGRYRGGDPTVNRNEVGHAATHTITNLIPDDRCRACHNRSGRIGLNYHGQMESAQYGTPFVRGGLNDETLSDGRFFLRLTPDIHHEKGMACIDCHTGQDTMGDGRIHLEMKDQIEIRCEDCHGGYTSPPKTTVVRKDDPLVQALIRSSPHVKPADGEVILLTSKGRPLPNVSRKGDKFVLKGKLTGKEHPVSIITGKRNGHTIKGHERLECDSCHSAWSPQCYGCHQVLDFGHEGLDHLTGRKTPGRWAEGRTYFRFERNILGINSRGRIGILVPGCQVWNTVVDRQGKVMPPYDSKIMRLKSGHTSVAMGPTHPHTSRTEVPRCVDCHLDAKALGLGEGRLVPAKPGEKLGTQPVYDSKGSGLKIAFPIDAVVDTDGTVLQGTSHEISRGFNAEEIKRIVGIGPCLACHDRYDDPVWEKPGPYRLTPDCRSALRRMEGTTSTSGD